MLTLNHGAFLRCTNLKNIDLPDGLQKIDEYAFEGCTSLTNIDIPYTILNINRYAFNNCTNLSTIIINAIKPPTIMSSTFKNLTNLKIYVPQKGYELYISNEPYWTRLKNSIYKIEELDESEEDD